MRMTASWSGSNDPTEYRSYAGGATNSAKSTSPTTELRERPMHDGTNLPVPEQTGIRGDCATLFVSLELSRSTWVATSLAPGSKKMSKHTLVGGDGRKLLDLLARLKTRAEQRIAAPVKVVAIHEVGLDGFWVHRLLDANGVESYVVDPASIAVPRRHRRAKTDAIDGETRSISAPAPEACGRRLTAGFIGAASATAFLARPRSARSPSLPRTPT